MCMFVIKSATLRLVLCADYVPLLTSIITSDTVLITPASAASMDSNRVAMYTSSSAPTSYYELTYTNTAAYSIKFPSNFSTPTISNVIIGD